MRQLSEKELYKKALILIGCIIIMYIVIFIATYISEGCI